MAVKCVNQIYCEYNQIQNLLFISDLWGNLPCGAFQNLIIYRLHEDEYRNREESLALRRSIIQKIRTYSVDTRQHSLFRHLIFKKYMTFRVNLL